MQLCAVGAGGVDQVHHAPNVGMGVFLCVWNVWLVGLQYFGRGATHFYQLRQLYNVSPALCVFLVNDGDMSMYYVSFVNVGDMPHSFSTPVAFSQRFSLTHVNSFATGTTRTATALYLRVVRSAHRLR